MSGETEVQDSPTEWVRSHIDQYVASDGADGHEWRGTTTLLLTTLGRKSGLPRRTALIYRQDGDSYVIVASQGGADLHPAWYLNLTANPEVTVQVKDETFTARARTAEGDERARLWKLMTEVWPDYDVYQTKTERQIPIVVLDRV
ncbi:MAG TPA: nitroreductase family deazaflavin-dependent oxidoreductase [Pseudonocardiaceae bacterium]|jgi:deazaflavin-dependent oxidoreductase (nitroreductase family)|nr:nitroreductase family deazaflavin-dependent oxidoreductase [Pseudonocardiaceae bacterium]